MPQPRKLYLMEYVSRIITPVQSGFHSRDVFFFSLLSKNAVKFCESHYLRYTLVHFFASMHFTKGTKEQSRNTILTLPHPHIPVGVHLSSALLVVSDQLLMNLPTVLHVGQRVLLIPFPHHKQDHDDCKRQQSWAGISTRFRLFFFSLQQL